MNSPIDLFELLASLLSFVFNNIIFILLLSVPIIFLVLKIRDFLEWKEYAMSHIAEAIDIAQKALKKSHSKKVVDQAHSAMSMADTAVQNHLFRSWYSTLQIAKQAIEVAKKANYTAEDEVRIAERDDEERKRKDEEAALIAVALNGSAESQYQLGLSYLEGKSPVHKNIDKANEWFQRAAGQGYAAAQNEMEKFEERRRKREALALEITDLRHQIDSINKNINFLSDDIDKTTGTGKYAPSSRPSDWDYRIDRRDRLYNDRINPLESKIMALKSEINIKEQQVNRIN
ncbi:MAG: SEL1-like repeat protein [Oscillospiraceae bacterium]|jgi:hypothetical protein|nr:SEL1-like repeat protein [Oscillospiraceae bacterium]